MPSIKSSTHFVRVNSLALAFPARIRSDANRIAALLQPTLTESQGIPVNVQGEAVVIPYRIGQSFDERLFRELNHTQALMYACMLSRSHDGTVRERQIERLVRTNEPWAAPFIAQLSGEYVVEILDTIERNLGFIDREIYGDFFSRNPAYLYWTEQRMVSYWNCNYRWLRKNEDDYVGFRLFKLFRDWQFSYSGIDTKSPLGPARTV